jgi:outer membrane protein
VAAVNMLKGSLAFFACTWPMLLRAEVNPLLDLLTTPGSVGLGALTRTYASPYVDAGPQVDLLPLYLYEGERLFLQASRIGLKLLERPEQRLDLILDYRFEGYPAYETPDSLSGMETRQGSADVGLSYRRETPWGQLRLEAVHDAFNINQGSELRLGYSFARTRGRLWLQPAATLFLRSAELNDYYYGVRPEEARPGRPAYQADAGVEGWLGLYAYYRLTQGWRLLGGAGIRFLGEDAGDSPIVGRTVQPIAYLGAAYDFSNNQAFAQERGPLYVKALYGQSTDCTLFKIVTLRCVSTHNQDDTDIVGIELGKSLVERVNGWPLDFVGYLSLIRHLEKGLQDDSWEVNAYVKGFFYGFPWSHRVKTRIGLGFGLSVAETIPYSEQQDAQEKGQTSSNLSSYMDPTIDVSVGDIVGAKKLTNTFLGIGVSHRSGIFGSAQLLGNTSSGSNYVYLYVESKL